MPGEKSILPVNPGAGDDSAEDAEQLYSLGNVLRRLGRLDDAATYYERAVVFDPDHAEAHNNLGNILRERGKTDEAVAHYERAVALNPGFVMAQGNLGIALQDMGRLDEAAARHRQAIAFKPDYAEAHYNLGNVLLRQERFDEATESYRRAIALKPDYAAAHVNLGNALTALGEFDDAAACYRQAIASRPDYAEAHCNLGNAFLRRDDLDQAETCYRRAIALRPDHAGAHYNLGNALLRQDRFDEAAASYRHTVALKLDHAEAHLDLGNALRSMGKIGEAAASYRQAAVLKPDYADAHANEAMALLFLGNFAEGWRKYEGRWLTKSMKPHALATPRWDGSDPQGKTILLQCEQGLGDSIQFIRYARMVKDRGAQVLLSCPSSLARLFENVAGIDRVFPDGIGLPAYDCHAPLLSLPMLFGTTLDSIPRSVPYILPDPDRAASWSARMQPCADFKVGLVWAGSPRPGQPDANAVDRRRSMRLDQFAPLAMPGLRFFSLQKGAPAAQTKTPPPGLTLADYTDEIEDFADTAALVANLDLVIGVDTSIVHLAGAMAKPVWVLSRFNGCWRWLMERADSPWYPTLRLFRQPKAGDWQSVIEAVRAELERLPAVMAATGPSRK